MEPMPGGRLGSGDDGRLVASRYRRLNMSAVTSYRRYQTVTLSASGRKLVPVLARLADRKDREFFGHLSKKERADQFAVLKDIAQTRGLKSVPVE